MDTKFRVRAFSSHLARTYLSQLVLSSRVIQASSSNAEKSLGMRLERLTYMTMKTHCGEEFKKSVKKNAVSERIDSAIKSMKDEEREKKDDNEKNSLSTYLAEYELSKDQIYSRYLSIDEVGGALSALLGREAQVTWSSKWSDKSIIWVRPPSFGGEKMDKAVTDAIHDALLEQ